MSKQAPNVAIIHDWLVGGGAERVVLELHRMYPEAPIYTSYCSDEWREKLDGKVITGFLQRWPFGTLRKFLPVLRIWWFTRLDFAGYDLVISSSGNGEAKGIKVPEGTTHVCYCHSPTHFYWRHYDHYAKNPGFGLFNPIASLGLKLLVGPLRRWDYKAAQRPHHFIANSNHIQNDIKEYYDRDATVIHPPIDIERFENKKPTARHGFITVGRLVPNKRVDIIVDACTQLNLPLTVVGRGPELSNLQKRAGPSITFDTSASDEQVVQYMASAETFLFASHEDFGITPVEAMAAGTPVIAYRAGGALDYVTPNTGLFFDEQTSASLAAALQTFDPKDYGPTNIANSAALFSSEVFRSTFTAYINKLEIQKS